MGKVADWYAGTVTAAGAWATMELFEISLARTVGKAATPILIATAVFGGTNYVGTQISAMIDPKKGVQRWNEYFVSPISKLTGYDSIHGKLMIAAQTHVNSRDRLDQVNKLTSRFGITF